MKLFAIYYLKQIPKHVKNVRNKAKTVPFVRAVERTWWWYQGYKKQRAFLHMYSSYIAAAA